MLLVIANFVAAVFGIFLVYCSEVTSWALNDKSERKSA